MAAQPRGLGARLVAGRPVGLAPAWLVGRERVKDRLLEHPGVLVCAQELARARRRAAMARDPAAGRRADLQVQLAEPGGDGYGLPHQAGRDAVAVALEGDER